MHQLKALIWNAYKVRLRSPLSSALDFVGPIVVIVLYILVRFLSNTEDPLIESDNYFTNIASPIDIPQNIGQFFCKKALYFSPSANAQNNQSSDSIQKYIGQKCGLELTLASSANKLVERLSDSLNQRISLRLESDLNISNSTNQSCKPLGKSNETNYQLGLVYDGKQSIDIYHTDRVQSPVIHQPFTQGSPFNEFRFPQSDMNTGLHFLEICLANAFDLSLGNTTNGSSDGPNSLKWTFRALPVTTAASIQSILFMTFVLASNFCNSIAYVSRAAEANENGSHHYIRTSGVSASTYWLAQFVVLLIHMTVQSLVIAILLATPTGDQMFEPIYEANITIRWLLLLTYSYSLTSHSLFIGSLFGRTSHSLLVVFLLAAIYAMWPLTFTLQWSPYKFSTYSLVQFLILMNPVSNFEALIVVIHGVVMQRNESFNLTHLPFSIIGGGLSDWTVGGLWGLLILQVFIWFIGTITIDHLSYSSTRHPLRLIVSLINELMCCSLCGTIRDTKTEEDKRKSASLAPSQIDKKMSGNPDGGAHKSGASGTIKDPNRICCSIINVGAVGPTVMMAKTRGDPLRLTKEQLIKLKMEEANKFKYQQIVSSNQSQLPNDSQYRANGRHQSYDEQIVIDDTVQQHVYWQKTDISLENLSLDFRFNQVSFVLGQTDLKDLFFNMLLGLRPLKYGHLMIEGTKYGPSDIWSARPHIGYLAERDIYMNEMTIFENLQFFGSLRDPSYTKYDSESSFILNLLHLSSRKENFPSVLTNRSARKLALAVAAVGHTKLLLLVEPTQSLRWRPRCQVLNLLKKYKSIRSIVVDTSDVDEATAFGDRIVLLRNGSVDLDDTPQRLSKKLACGYWLIFEPTGGNQMTSASVAALEKLSNDIFKQDKLEHLKPTTRSVYQEVMHSSGKNDADLKKNLETRNSSIPGSSITNDELHKSILILKVRHTDQSHKAICSILKMFSRNSIQGFKFNGLAYESLEDVMILRMSKAIYPDLPPDLLLSLQHRTKTKPASNTDSPQTSVRQCSSDYQIPKVAKPMFGAKTLTILKDRISHKLEVTYYLCTIVFALVIMSLVLIAMKANMEPSAPNFGNIYTNSKNELESSSSTLRIIGSSTRYESIAELFKHRVGLYILGSNSSSREVLKNWPGNKALSGTIPSNLNITDVKYITQLIRQSKELLAGLIAFDSKNGQTVVITEPLIPNSMIVTMKNFIDFKMSSTRSIRLNTSHYTFMQSWHEMFYGYYNRRLYYCLGFAIAEGLALSIFIIAPMRHRSESRVMKVRTTYWFSMAIFDFILSVICVVGYVIVFTIFEQPLPFVLSLWSLLVMCLYRLASLPITYLVSLVAESALNGFLFLFYLLFTISWVFSIHLKTFIEWTLIGEGYLFPIATWIVELVPFSAMMESIVVINQINRMNVLCPQVPAYVATTNIVDLDGSQTISILDKQAAIVRECLSGGKSGISTSVMHQGSFGIMWNIYLMFLFGTVTWLFLLYSELVFGFLGRRSELRASYNPMKTIVRSSEPSTSLFKWDREKDRLVGEYIRCMNESRYVKSMAENCLYLRVWLRPMSDQWIVDQRLALILEPLASMGQPKNEISVELKTTLQIFIRLGTESSRCKLDKIQLIETFSKFVSTHNDKVVKFAIVNWTRESLYKILLHGHYNIKSSSLSG